MILVEYVLLKFLVILNLFVGTTCHEKGAKSSAISYSCKCNTKLTHIELCKRILNR